MPYLPSAQRSVGLAGHPGPPVQQVRSGFGGHPDPDVDELSRARGLRHAAQVVCQGFDAGVFVRDTSHDHESGWARRATPYLAALGVLANAVGPKESAP